MATEKMGERRVKKTDTPDTPTTIARREKLPANIILNKDVGITDLESRDEIADIREKDHFVRALFVRVDKMADMSEEEQKEIIEELTELVTRASRFARAEIQIEKAKKNPKTMWELISKLLVELLPKQLQIEGASETEQLLRHLEKIGGLIDKRKNEFVTAEKARTDKIANDEKTAAQKEFYNRLKLSDLKFAKLAVEQERGLRYLEATEARIALLSQLMEQNVITSNTAREYPRWNEHVKQAMEDVFNPRAVPMSIYKQLGDDRYGGESSFRGSQNAIQTEVMIYLKHLKSESEAGAMKVSHALDVAMQEEKTSS